MDAQLLLERDLQVEDGPVGLGGLRHQAGELPELRFLLARRRAEGGRVDRPDPLGKDPEAGAAEQLARVVADFLQVLRPLHEDVGDREGVIERERGLCPPWRTSSAQILVGMSTRRPQPSPSPSTFPARWSIFCSDSSASVTGSWLGVASRRTDA